MSPAEPTRPAGKGNRRFGLQITLTDDEALAGLHNLAKVLEEPGRNRHSPSSGITRSPPMRDATVNGGATMLPLDEGARTMGWSARDGSQSGAQH